MSLRPRMPAHLQLPLYAPERIAARMIPNPFLSKKDKPKSPFYRS